MPATLSPAMQALANALADARMTGSQIDNAAVPADLAEALQMQAEILNRMGETIAGWKIARHPQFRILGAPLPAGFTKANEASFSYPELLGVEVEIAMRLSRDVPAAYSPADITASIEQMCVGVELVRTRLKSGNDPFLPFLADGMANVGYVTGEWMEWRDHDLQALSCRVALNSDILHSAPCVPSQGSPISVLMDAPSASLAHCGGLKKGQIVTTGSLCGVVALPSRTGELFCTIEGVGSVSVQMKA